VTKTAGKNTAGAQDQETASEASGSPHRERILQAALALLTAGGRDAVTTRAVAEAAGVQPPVLYRLFQDKRGLLDAVTDYGFALYFSEKRQPHPTEDPVQFLRYGWARHIQFGLSHPELYLLMYADPHPGASGRSARHAQPGLRAHMHSIALAGRLRIPEDRAAALFHAAACGVVMTLLTAPEGDRDMALSDVACEAALASIATGLSVLPDSTAAAAANMLRAQMMYAGTEHLPASTLFTKAETSVLLEWLDRLTDPPR
jgi:AcrR family transcriptional regulator